MARRKLRLAVPVGQLVKPETFNVRDILKLAGIGRYIERDDKYRDFAVNEELGIETLVKKPRDIPAHIAKGFSDIGITGRDWVEEVSRSHFVGYKPKLSPKIGDLEKLKKLIQRINQENFIHHRSYRFKLDQLVDLGCSYVDMAFMTTPENWMRAQEFKDVMTNGMGLVETHVIGPIREGMVLLQYYFARTNRDRTIRCYSEYPKTADHLLRMAKFSNIFHHPSFKVYRSHAKTEGCINSGEADIILETYATGHQAREGGLSIVEVVPETSSTARLYARPNVRKMRDVVLQEKIDEIKGRIEDVVNDIDNYCQVRVVLKSCGKTEEDPNQLEHDIFEKYDLGETVSIYYQMIYRQPNPRIFVDRIMNKKDLPKIERFLRMNWKNNALTHLGSENNPSRVDLYGAICFDLKHLYSYCPTLVKNNEFREMLFYSTFSDVFMHGVKQGKYPCCDLTKLRPEHREKASIPLGMEGSIERVPGILSY